MQSVYVAQENGTGHSLVSSQVALFLGFLPEMNLSPAEILGMRLVLKLSDATILPLLWWNAW